MLLTKISINIVRGLLRKRPDLDIVRIQDAGLIGADDSTVIEEYPDDKYSPTCLIYGKTRAGRVLHVQVSLPPLVVIVTAYEPDSEQWIDGKIRR